MTIEEKQNQIIDEFSFFTNWEGKFEYIIELGKDLPLIDAKYKTPENIIKGCQSQVWLHADLVDGKIVFTADSDAVITKGIISLLISVLSGHSPKEVAEAELFFVDKIGLKEHLSPTRSNGLLSMVKQMKMYGIAFQAKV